MYVLYGTLNTTYFHKNQLTMSLAWKFSKYLLRALVRKKKKRKIVENVYSHISTSISSQAPYRYQ